MYYKKKFLQLLLLKLSNYSQDAHIENLNAITEAVSPKAMFVTTTRIVGITVTSRVVVS